MATISDMRTILTLFILFALTPSALAGGDLGSTAIEGGVPFISHWDTTDSIWTIETNLPAGHPCAYSGGVWRGWCMDIFGTSVRTFMETKKPPTLVRTGGTTRVGQDACMGIASRTERRTCYRERQLQLRTGTRQR